MVCMVFDNQYSVSLLTNHIIDSLTRDYQAAPSLVLWSSSSPASPSHGVVTGLLVHTYSQRLIIFVDGILYLVSSTSHRSRLLQSTDTLSSSHFTHVCVYMYMCVCVCHHLHPWVAICTICLPRPSDLSQIVGCSLVHGLPPRCHLLASDK